jgi:GT2 family glycosyltransferase
MLKYFKTFSMTSLYSQTIVFDQFQRYNIIRQIIEVLNTKPRFQILEVGAAFSPLRRLTENHSLVLLDEQFSGTGVDVGASGSHLPFANQSFDIVISTDVLEHIKNDERPSFLNELCRVTSQTLILGFPQDIPESNFVDRSFLEYIRARTNQESEYLNEHLKFGLPNPAEVRKLLEPQMAEILEFENSNTSSWLFLQNANFTASNIPELKKAADALNDIFNRQLNDFSHTPQCYRKFFVCFKKPIEQSVTQKLLEVTKPKALNAVDLYASTSHALAESFEDELLRFKREMNKQLESSLETIRVQEKRIQQQEEEIRNYHAQILNLEDDVRAHILTNRGLQDYLNLFLNHPVYKTYKFLKSVLIRIYPRVHDSFSHDMKYAYFQRAFEPTSKDLRRQQQEWRTWEIQPLLNLVTAVCDPPFSTFRQAVESILRQNYGNWIWNLADASKTEAIWNYLKDLSHQDSRIRPIRLSENNGISANTNVALRATTGDYVVLFDHDDTLAPHALFAVASAIRNDPGVEFLYSDADLLDTTGQRCRPFFKPDWSPEAMLSYNLLNQLSVFRRTWLDVVGFLDPQLDGAQDWDLYFRITEKTNRIHHIPQILYHWRISAGSTAQSIRNKPYAQAAQLTAIRSHLKRTGLQEPEVSFVAGHPVYQTYPLSRWKLTRRWNVSIIIPSCDQPDLLSSCLQSIFEKTTYENYDVILVDTGSKNQHTLQLYDQYRKNDRFTLVRYEGSFNFGRACNQGAAHASGDLLLFLNNDTEVIQPDWLQLMVQWFEREGVGIVGPKLLFPDGRIQHAGVIVGFGGLAGHLFHTDKENANSLSGSEAWYRNLSAVTGACLLIHKNAFAQVKGFDEEFQLNYSDVDLCLRIREAGFRIVYTPQVRLIHHESATHKGFVPRKDFDRASLKWQNILKHGDPYFNPNLTYSKARPDFKTEKTDSPAKLHERLMRRLPQKELIVLPDDIQ